MTSLGLHHFQVSISMRERFEQIYSTNEWQHGSGEGSLPEHNRGYISFVEDFLRRHQIASVVDLGCGDWQFSRYIRWGSARYRGFDIVPAVIAANTARFATAEIGFELYDGDPRHLPDGDLLIAKDVVQHWSDQAIRSLLPELDRYKHVLITNCVNPCGVTIHSDIADGDFRYLDLRLEPFRLNAEEVFAFSNRRSLFNRIWGRPRWLKKVLHYQGRNPISVSP